MQQNQTNTFANQDQFHAHASTTFGSGNRFLNTPSTGQPQQQGGFNPNQMKFGSSNSGFKTFNSFGQSNLSNPFGQQSSPSNPFGQTQAPQQSWIANSNNTNQNSSQGGWLNNSLQQQNNQAQFNQGGWPNNNQNSQGNLPWMQNSNQGQNFNQNANVDRSKNLNMFPVGGNYLKNDPPAGINPMLLQPRK
jgi:hypothetical protein